MRRLLVALGFIGACTVPAGAADYPAVPELQELYNWTGFAIGVTGGWAFDGELEAEPKDLPFIKFEQEHDGGVVGGFANARWQFQGAPLVLGAEVTGLAAWIAGEDSYSDLLVAPFVLDSHSSVSSIITAEGQVGVAFDRVLAYVAGGFALADVNFDAKLKVPGLFSEKIFEASNNVDGVVIGGGIDYALPNSPVVLGVSFKHLVFNDLGLSDKLEEAGGPIYSAVPCSRECGNDGYKINTNSNLTVDQIMGRISIHF